jgi:hypothetical protein
MINKLIRDNLMIKLMESMFLDKFPNSSKDTILEAKREAAVEWAYDSDQKCLDCMTNM